MRPESDEKKNCDLYLPPTPSFDFSFRQRCERFSPIKKMGKAMEIVRKHIYLGICLVISFI